MKTVCVMLLLKIRDLCKYYREAGKQHLVLNKLQLDLQAGQSIAILGRSGCGKSTLLNLIAGLDSPDSGSVEIQGKNLNQLSDTERTLLRRKHIGFIFQFFNLVPTLTVLENIQLPLELLGIHNHTESIRKQLQQLNLLQYQHRFPEQLSGGEQQRVALLRAIAHRPTLLLADEPTGNLDHETGDQVAQLLFQSVTAESGLIVVTHSQEIAEHAQTIYRLQDGQLKHHHE